jgi:hypothetical protein
MTSSSKTRLVLAREFERLGGDRHALARAHTSGRAIRLRRGVYASAAEWTDLEDLDRYLLRIRAVGETRRERPVLSHWSAAAIWGIPIIGRWPSDVHRVIDRASGGRSKNGVVAHVTEMASVDVVEIDGLLVTSFARTIVDLATVSSAMSGVAGADYALHRKRSGHFSKDQLLAEWEAAKPLKAHTRSLRILEFATHLADSPAESAGRVNMYLAGFPEPRLQTPFFDVDGFIGEPDYDFEGYDHLGEVDGRFKYFKPEYLRGREPGDVIYEEKIREDRFKALPKKVTRWDWAVCISIPKMRARLLRDGLPIVDPHRRWRR